MIPAEHERYAKELLSSFADDRPEIESLHFDSDRTKSRNAARAMAEILCHRVFRKSGHRPSRLANKTYKWIEGIFVCRNIADRDYMWTNIRRPTAEVIHDYARIKPVAYLLVFSKPQGATLSVWALPEPLLHESLSRLPTKKSDQAYTVEIHPDKQRIKTDPASPDLAAYFQEVPLSRQELLILSEAREVDALVKIEKRERKGANGDDAPDSDEDEDEATADSDTDALLAAAARQLTEAGAFDPAGIVDARERVLSSIVRRRGQLAFREHLLAAYNGQCAITACDFEPVLDAAHIMPYKGAETNHPTNGLLLRTDVHTLFDLKMIAIDVAMMRLLVSASLTGTCYDAYRGRPIRVPDDPISRPSRVALEQHRKESGL